MKESQAQARLAATSLKVNATKLRRGLEAAYRVLEDNEQDWWCPLTDYEVDAINPATLAINAKEGAARARAALLLLSQALDVSEAVERISYALAASP
jgi:hypothetical protein